MHVTCWFDKIDDTISSTNIIQFNIQQSCRFINKAFVYNSSARNYPYEDDHYTNMDSLTPYLMEIGWNKRRTESNHLYWGEYFPWLHVPLFLYGIKF